MTHTTCFLFSFFLMECIFSKYENRSHAEIRNWTVATGHSCNRARDDRSRKTCREQHVVRKKNGLSLGGDCSVELCVRTQDTGARTEERGQREGRAAANIRGEVHTNTVSDSVAK